ncbi:hypothetical protein [Aureibacter tunicatorum]|uniref:Uncharacterized protein n=1 Tax=Aureibacter tunicatorum TaxID=866807 RepID=A0AAE3XPV1_9BACT|nr:hypothetical protein [Aureibacter tunicatorum]MDR6241851.1 hypothetical protein [Aureibacter tunicatorum]
MSYFFDKVHKKTKARTEGKTKKQQASSLFPPVQCMFRRKQKKDKKEVKPFAHKVDEPWKEYEIIGTKTSGDPIFGETKNVWRVVGVYEPSDNSEDDIPFFRITYKSRPKRDGKEWNDVKFMSTFKERSELASSQRHIRTAVTSGGASPFPDPVTPATIETEKRAVVAGGASPFLDPVIPMDNSKLESSRNLGRSTRLDPIKESDIEFAKPMSIQSETWTTEGEQKSEREIEKEVMGPVTIAAMPLNRELSRESDGPLERTVTVPTEVTFDKSNSSDETESQGKPYSSINPPASLDAYREEMVRKMYESSLISDGEGGFYLPEDSISSLGTISEASSVPGSLNTGSIRILFGQMPMARAYQFRDVRALEGEEPGKFATIFMLGNPGEDSSHVLKVMKDTPMTPAVENEAFANNFVRLVGRRVTAPATRKLNQKERTKMDKYIKRGLMGSAAELNIGALGRTADAKCLFMERASGDTFRSRTAKHSISRVWNKELLKGIGELAILDILLGNVDRFIGHFNDGNVLMDSRTGSLSGIDQTLNLGGMLYMAKVFNQETTGYMETVNSYFQRGNDMVRNGDMAAMDEILDKLPQYYYDLFIGLLDAHKSGRPHVFFQHIFDIWKGVGKHRPLGREESKHMLDGMVEAMKHLAEDDNLFEMFFQNMFDLHDKEHSAFLSNWQQLKEAVKAFEKA